MENKTVESCSSKKQRHAVYKKVLKYMEENEEEGKPKHLQNKNARHVGLCPMLYFEGLVPLSISWSWGLEDLVEFQSFKPANYEPTRDLYWFKSREERMEVLRKCIKMSKPSLWERVERFLSKK